MNQNTCHQLETYFEEFISSVCWLFPLCNFRNSTAFTPWVLCVCVWGGGGACATFELKSCSQGRRKKAGEQFPALTEASLDSLSRFFPR